MGLVDDELTAFVQEESRREPQATRVPLVHSASELGDGPDSCYAALKRKLWVGPPWSRGAATAEAASTGPVYALARGPSEA
jgi:hypothetical protein